MQHIHKTVIFTKTPLTGYYRYNDTFQVYPAKLDSLPVSKLQSHFPAMLEYTTTDEEIINPDSQLFEGLEDLYQLTSIRVNKEIEIMSLLSFATNHLFFKYDSEGRWATPTYKDETGEEKVSSSSAWCMGYYHFPELPDQLKITEFSEPDCPHIATVEQNSYYMNDPNIDFTHKKSITIPQTLNIILDSYFKINDKAVALAVDSAIAYCVSSIEMRMTKKTASMLMSFTAVEAMVNMEFRGVEAQQCETCGQLRYSIARKFREYLLKYLGNSENNRKKFNNYYSLRSKIVHTGERLKNEKLFSDVTQSERDTEFITQLEILQLGKMAITNWLIKNR